MLITSNFFASDVCEFGLVESTCPNSPPRRGAHSALRRPTQHGSAVSGALRQSSAALRTRLDVRLPLLRPLRVSSFVTSLLLSPASAGYVQPDKSPAGHTVRRLSAMRGPRVWLGARARLRPAPRLNPATIPHAVHWVHFPPGPPACGQGPSSFAASGFAASGFAASCDPPLFEDTVCTGDARFSDHALARCLPVKSALLMPFLL